MDSRTLRAGANGIVVVAWLAFLVSFFLPATNILEVAGTPPGTPLSGWQAFKCSLSAGAFNFWAWIGDLRVVLFLTFPVTNAIMVAAPTFGWLKRGSLVPALILIPAAIVPWLLPHDLLGDLYVGFYIWNASHWLAALGGCLLAITSQSCED